MKKEEGKKERDFGKVEWKRAVASPPPSKNRTGEFPLIRLKPL